MEFEQSIAVLGPLGAGKSYLFQEIGKRITKQWPLHVPEPSRYRIHSEDYPELQKYVFSVYKKASQLKLDVPEHIGLLVLKWAHLIDFFKPDALRQYLYFFEFLRKLVGLGVDHYVLTVTHMDLFPADSISWYNDTVDQLARALEKTFGLSIQRPPIPIATGAFGRLDTLSKTKANMASSYNDSSLLLEALNRLASSSRRPNRGLWVLGGLEHRRSRKGLYWKTGHQARRCPLGKRRVRIYPPGIECIVKDDNRIISADNPPSEFHELDSFSEQNQFYIMVASDSTATDRSVIELHAFLDDSVNSNALQDENRSFSFTFFGPQNSEGEIDRSIPIKIHNEFPENLFSEAISADRPETFGQAIGHESQLLIYCRKTGVIAETYKSDQDAGRVLIWDHNTNGEPILIGVGRITGFPDMEIQDYVEKLILFDQFRVGKNPQTKMLSFVLEKIYHNSKTFMETSADELDLDFIRDRQIEVKADFQRILDETLYVQETIRKKGLPNQLRNLHPHLHRARQKLSEQFQEIANLLEREKPEEAIERKMRSLREDYVRTTQLIRKQTIFPFRSSVKGTVRKQPREMRIKINVLDRLPRKLSYYPRRPAVLDQLSETLSQLLDNSQWNRGREYPLKINIFIDPPTIKTPDCIMIHYQDNGILTKEVHRKMEKSESGIRVAQQKLSLEGVSFDLSPHIGAATASTLRIPVWTQRLNTLENLSADLLEIFCAVDFEMLKNEDDFPDFLGRFYSILKNSVLKNWDGAHIRRVITNLLIEAENSTCMHKAWFHHNRAFLSDPLQPASYNEIQKIKAITFQLLQKPTVYAIEKAVLDAKAAFPKYHIHIENIHDRHLLHRIESASVYYFLRDTVFWGLRDHILPCISVQKASKLVFGFESQRSGQGDEILVILSGLRIPNLSKIIVPFRTRMLLFESVSATVDELKGRLILRVPANKLGAKGVQYKW